MLAHTTEAAADGFKDCDQFFPPVRAAWPYLIHLAALRRLLLSQGTFDDGRVGRGLPAPGWENLG